MGKDALATLKETNGSRNGYGIDETLAILAMFAEGQKLKAVADLTGRSVNSLRYKFLEGEITEKDGSKVIRSMKRFTNVKEIFAYFEVEFISAEDVKARIQKYKASRTSSVA